ncbi:IS630 family transposase [Streptomyces sp. NPDC006290]|uniref:IS630 family transposase n=1 Tax=Streptomyces sp. NPDC006290 TaxID=3156745 RepID=UPI0033A5D955
MVAPGHRCDGRRHRLRRDLSPPRVGRILADLDLKPHRVRGWLTRRDTPDFWERVADVCDLYRNPPEGAVVLSIDEKTAIAARSRRHPGRPAAPRRPARSEFEYHRHGTASLVAALNVCTGEVLAEIIARNDAVTFTAFLDQLDAVIAPDQDIHVVLDNGSSHTAKHTRKWLADHPRWHVHWTPPHASWLNQVELFFSTLARRVLRHGDFSSRDDLIDKLESYVINHNSAAKPYKWTYDGTPLKTACPARTPLHELPRSSTSQALRRARGCGPKPVSGGIAGRAERSATLRCLGDGGSPHEGLVAVRAAASRRDGCTVRTNAASTRGRWARDESWSGFGCADTSVTGSGVPERRLSSRCRA